MEMYAAYVLVLASAILRTSNGFTVECPLRLFDIDEKANEYVSLDDFRQVKVLPFSDFSQITAQVYLTSIGTINGINLMNNHIGCIFDLAREYNYTLPSGCNIKHFQYKSVSDKPDDDIAPLLDEIVSEMESCVKKGKNVVVHCFAGASRSGTAVTAYLIKHENMSLKDAFLHTKSRREIYRPNNGFMKQLIDYEIKNRGVASVKMINLVRDNFEIEVPDFFNIHYPKAVDQDFDTLKTPPKKTLRRILF